MTFAAYCRINFDIVSIDFIIMLLFLLMVIRSVIRIVCIYIVFMVFFALLKTFAIFIKCPCLLYLWLVSCLG